MGDVRDATEGDNKASVLACLRVGIIKARNFIHVKSLFGVGVRSVFTWTV